MPRFLNGCTFAFMSPRGFTKTDEWKASFDQMLLSTRCNSVTIAVAALQDHAYSTQVDYETPDVMSMDDVRSICAYAKERGISIVLKAMVNCRDGYWRAFIRFFDTYVPTEPTWAQWFGSYQAFTTALAKVAEEEGATLYCVGCEMVGTDHREAEWRELISAARSIYSGAITYNCDKYQEHNIRWWDAVDIISSSGYYPIDALETNFDRIEAVVKREGKPFMFLESGCPSREGSEMIPNNWNHQGKTSSSAQAIWYQAFTAAILDHPWISGVVWWDWSAVLRYERAHALLDNGYCVYGKPAEGVLAAFDEAIGGDSQALSSHL